MFSTDLIGRMNHSAIKAVKTLIATKTLKQLQLVPQNLNFQITFKSVKWDDWISVSRSKKKEKKKTAYGAVEGAKLQETKSSFIKLWVH